MTPSQIATIANQRVLAGLFIFGGLVVTPLTTTAQQTGIPDGIVDSTGSPKEQILQAFQKRIQLTRNEVDRLETRLGPLSR